jgi:VanZ family protein
MFTKRGWKGWIWPALLAMAIVLASGRSKLASPDIVGIDKASHFFVFGLLGILVARNGFLPRFGWLAVLAVSVFGLTDEWHQSFTPGRDVEVADWIADTLGAAVAVGLYSRWLWFSRLLETPLAGPHDRVEKSADIVPDTEVHETR